MKLKKKGMLFSGLCAVLCLLFAGLFGIGEAVCRSMTEDMDALSTGERWSAAGENYAVIALHTDADNALSRNTVESYAMAIESGLLNASMASPENGSIWTYSYFAEDLLSVTGPKATAQIRTMAVGGSFFTFHPLEFLAGAPFAYDRALPDGVVLDEEAAWRLFGATDVVGMTLQAGGRELTVTGIVCRERDTAGYEKAYGEIPRMYMSYYGYEHITGEGNNITTCEVTLPDPVESFAMNIFQNAVRVREDSMVVRENSSRYDFVNRFRRMQELPYAGMRNDRIIYPYFENELQVTDYRTSVCMQFQTIAASVALVCLLASVIALFASGFSVTGILKSGWSHIQKQGEKHGNSSRKNKRKRKKSTLPEHQ